ncbi:hypothetical protein DERF_013825 [Dermatophagoides farinae]|uniref:Uncharacterized protein n=1 Tax=Dermatophagoides farinae TaxID=6954 RepID=A0A922HN32_DERFA|nr:uncharacterized protein LOC124499656 [Dermatophagoides farinae]KAH7645312.1 hypothetical protein HUG17_0850 [Dermatophagoides farinae]KAH9497877.1 hypothetical protein DERF_013825 [Dermatophagoides farinae]
MLFKIKTFLYDAIKHIVDDNGTVQYRLLHNIDVSLYVYWLIRGLMFSLIFIDPERFPLYRYDYISLYIWNHQKILNKFFVLIVILFIFTGFLGIRTFFFNNVDELSFRLLYDCIVYNTDQYYKSRDTDENIAMKLSQRFEDYQQRFARNHRLLSKIIPPFLVNRLFRIRVCIDSWLQMDRVDKDLFENQNKMRLFPNAPLKGRNYILLFVLIMDFCNYCLHIFIMLTILISGVIVIYFQISQFDIVQNSFVLKLCLMIEVILFTHNTFVMLQCAMLLSGTMLASFNAYYNQLAYMNQNFKKIIKNSKTNQRQINMLKELRFINNEHNTLSYYIIYSDKSTWSQALYYYALVSLPINVLFMCELIFEDMPAQTQFVFILISLIHAISGLLPFMTTAHVSSAFHKIKDYIPAMQLQLNRSTHLRMKLKYDDLYERLMSGKKIAFTFGYLGNLTYRGLFEAFLGYIAAFFMIMGFYLREHST